MILTCPRCATRYLADAIQVWTTGRTVQCEACGQRWRAVGEGARPVPEPEPSAAVEPSPAEAAAFAATSFPVEEAPRPASPEPVESAPQARAESPEVAEAGIRDPAPALRASPPDPSPEAGDSLRVNLTKPASSRLATSFGSGPSRAGSWLAITFLVLIVLAALLMFRAVIVHAFPGLAPIYAAMGLLVHPVASPHG